MSVDAFAVVEGLFAAERALFEQKKEAGIETSAVVLELCL